MQLSMETDGETDVKTDGETVTVAAAMIESNGRYLLCKRSVVKENAGMWEFPGGKVKEGESLKACVEREYQEEFGQGASAGEILASTQVTSNGKILRLFGLKTEIQTEPVRSHDHDEIRWFGPEEFSRLPMTSAELGLIQNLSAPKKIETEVKAVNVWSCAKLGGFLYGIVGVFCGMFLYFFSQFIPSPLASWQRLFIVFSLPVFNFFLGAFLGAFVAVLYNLLTLFVGGIKLRLD